jgi:hypothetical protein
MLSKLSWGLLIATGMVGSGAGIAVTRPAQDESLPHTAPTAAPASVAIDVDAMLRSNAVNDEFRNGYARAQAASREPFAAFRVTPSRH